MPYEELVGWGLTAAMLALLMLRIPVAVALIGTGYVGMVLMLGREEGGVDWLHGMRAANAFLAKLAHSSTADYTFTTVPMFLLMGYVAAASGFTSDVYTAARVWLARIPGGLAVASAVGCAVFGAICGSSVATAAAMGRIAVPEMLARGYDSKLACGVVAAAGTLGALIPPSILMVLYGVFTEQSIAKLFVAGIVPGLLSLAMYVLFIVIRVRLNPALAPREPSVPFAEKVRALKGTWAMLLLIALVITGLYTGWFTPTEAGGVGAGAALALCVLTRRMDRGKFETAVNDTLRNTSMLFAAIIGAYMVTSFTALTGIADGITNWAAGFDVPPFVTILSLSVLYIVLGTFMGAVEMMLLTMPIVVPIVQGLGYDLIWFGVMMVKYLEIGLISPPIGLNVFVIKGVVGDRVPLNDVFRGTYGFLAMDCVTIALLTAFPKIATFLPDLM
jgi:tripartite ATP-independent transporter DctM subunit